MNGRPVRSPRSDGYSEEDEEEDGAGEEHEYRSDHYEDYEVDTDPTYHRREEKAPASSNGPLDMKRGERRRGGGSGFSQL